jgi:hypothetical protein
MFYVLIRVMTQVQESDPDIYPYFAYLVSLTSYFISLDIWITCTFDGKILLFYWSILLLFISWKADILSTTVEILFDDYLKPAWTNIIFLFGITNIHLRLPWYNILMNNSMILWSLRYILYSKTFAPQCEVKIIVFIVATYYFTYYNV